MLRSDKFVVSMRDEEEEDVTMADTQAAELPHQQQKQEYLKQEQQLEQMQKMMQPGTEQPVEEQQEHEESQGQDPSKSVMREEDAGVEDVHEAPLLEAPEREVDWSGQVLLCSLRTAYLFLSR
jgi:hypothetical protein